MDEIILKAALSKFSSTRDSLMIEINLLADSESYVDGIVNTLTLKISELAIIDRAIEQTQSFIAQALTQKFVNIAMTSQNNDNIIEKK